MSSIFAWNEYMKTFINELCETFPECVELFALTSAIEAMISEDEYSVLNKFVEEIEPHTEALTNMEEDVFLDADIDFLKRLGVKQYWTPDLEAETKGAIWQYLQTLLVMGKTIQSVPPEMLRVLESYAGKVTGEMGDGFDESQIDLEQLGLGAIKHMQSQEPNLFGQMFAQAEQMQRQQQASGAQPTQQQQQQNVNQLLNQAFSSIQGNFAAPTPNAQPQSGPQLSGFDKLQKQFAAMQTTAPAQAVGNIPFPAGYQVPNRNPSFPGQFPAQFQQPQTMSFSSNLPNNRPSGVQGGNIWAPPPTQPLFSNQPTIPPLPNNFMPQKK